jgi:hypothetical protein
MRNSVALSLVVGLLAALFISSCSNSSSPTDPGTDQTYQFDPPPGRLNIDALDTLKITVSRKDGAPVSGVFYVDEDSVAAGSTLRWSADILGEVAVKLVLPPADAPTVVNWTVTVSDANVTPPSPVSLVQASRGALPGSIATSWNRPGAGKELIDHYLLYYSTSHITEEKLPETDFVNVDHDPSIIVQSELLTGLQERTQYYLRVQLVDVLGRAATLSAESTSLSTGHYRVSGRITRLAEGGGVEGFPEVLAEVGDHRALSGSDGSYVIDDIPDLARKRLTLKPSRPLEINSYYWVVTDTLELKDQEFDALLFKPLPQVLIDPTNDQYINNLEFLYIMASKTPDGAAPPIIQRWESYPIPVRVDADSAETIAGENVTVAMEGAIATWNTQAGEQLLMPVTGKPSYGANFNVYVTTTSGGSILGEVRIVEPPDMHCLYRCIPQQVVVNLYSPETADLVDRVLVHELGHVLWMTHSPNTNHLMSAGVNSTSPLVPDPAEVRMARLIAHIPNGTDLRWYKFPAQP